MTPAPKQTPEQAAPAPEPTPIDQTDDGKLKVMTLTDNGQSESFDIDHVWTATGSGFEGNGWDVTSSRIELTPGGDICPVDTNKRSATELGFQLPDGGDRPAAGTYPNARLLVGVVSDTESDTMTLPINLVVA